MICRDNQCERVIIVFTEDLSCLPTMLVTPHIRDGSKKNHLTLNYNYLEKMYLRC